MSKCPHECKSDKRIREAEQAITAIRAEMDVYIKQLTNNISDIKATVDSLKNKQMNKAEIREIVRETVKSLEENKLKDNSMRPIIFEILKLLGTALAIIGGMKIVG